MSAATLDAGSDDGSTFSRVAVIGLLTVAIGAFGLLVVLAAYAPEWRGDERGGGNALSRSAVGFAGIVELMRGLGVSVTVDRAVATARGRRGLLVLTPPAGHKPEAVRVLAARQGTTLIVLPKWQTQRDKEHPAWVTKDGLIGLPQAALPLPVAGTLSRRTGVSRPVLRMAPGSALAGMTIGALTIGAWSVDGLQTLDASAAWTPVLIDETGKAVLARRAGGDLYALADPDLLDTQALKDGDVARTAAALLDALRRGEPVTFDVTLDGLGQHPSLLRLLFEPPLLGGTLCAAAAALAILLMAVRRFGPPEREDRAVAFGKRALADNAARLIGRAGRERTMGVPYAEAIRDAAVRSLGGLGRGRAGASPSDAGLDAASRAIGLPETYSALADAAGRAPDRAALLRAARRLNQWARGLSRGRQ